MELLSHEKGSVGKLTNWVRWRIDNNWYSEDWGLSIEVRTIYFTRYVSILIISNFFIYNRVLSPHPLLF